MQQLDLGSAIVVPDAPVVAGSFVTLTFVYTAGHPVDDTGFIKIVFRSVCDFGTPQFEKPGSPNYCTVRTTGDCHIEPRWDPKGHTRPWWRSLYLQVTGGYLDRGQHIAVVFGDADQGSPGWQMQTHRETTFEFKTLVDPIATYEFKELPVSPTLPIVAGFPDRAVCIAPSQVSLGQPFGYHLKLEDQWGNPTKSPERRVHPGFDAPGIQSICALDRETGLKAVSNPIGVLSEAPTHRLYWADFHGQTEETCGSNSMVDYFHFAREHGLLDICGHQGNDFEVSDGLWEIINATTQHQNEEGRFITFPGYEWSGNTPLGGDRNVYFASESGQIVHSCTDLLPGKRTSHPVAPTAAELFRELKQQKGAQTFAFAHVGGRYADLSMHDPEVELAVEIHSAWGTFEWLLEDALSRGYRIGICANSDGHKTRPGASYPGSGEFGSLGGLTCVLAPELTRASILTALRARHFYATTGNRALLEVHLAAEDGRQAMMGDVVDLDGSGAHLHVRVAGTAAIESVQVRNGAEAITKVIPYANEEPGRRIKIAWSGAQVRGRARQTSWDGGLVVRDNTILSVRPINFWNPLRPVRHLGPDSVSWQSVTTGGLCGVILSLEKPFEGTLSLETAQGDLACELAAVGVEPAAWEFGGLSKRVEIHRLPDENRHRQVSFDVPLDSLHKGDNPVYVRVAQEDGHLAWSSPIYVAI